MTDELEGTSTRSIRPTSATAVPAAAVRRPRRRAGRRSPEPIPRGDTALVVRRGGIILMGNIESANAGKRTKQTGRGHFLGTLGNLRWRSRSRVRRWVSDRSCGPVHRRAATAHLEEPAEWLLGVGIDGGYDENSKFPPMQTRSWLSSGFQIQRPALEWDGAQLRAGHRASRSLTPRALPLGYETVGRSFPRRLNRWERSTRSGWDSPVGSRPDRPGVFRRNRVSFRRRITPSW